MSWSISCRSKRPHGRICNHVGDHFKSDSGEEVDKLTYHVVVQTCKFVILAMISMLGDDGGGLAEREPSGGVVNSKPKKNRVLDRDKIRPIFLNVEQFYGVHLGDRRRMIIILVLLWIKEQFANEGVDDTGLTNDEFEVVLGVVHKLLMNPKDFFVIKIFLLRLRIKELVVGPIVGVLGGEVLTILLWCVNLHAIGMLALDSWSNTGLSAIVDT